MTPAAPKNQPLSGNAMPRCGGIACKMRLPVATTPQGLDAPYVGVPLDIGNTPCDPSFDIDGIDPAYTGTPEIDGLSLPQALEINRGCHGLNMVGCDLVKVSPPYDTSGNTALLGANLLFEMLCVLPGVLKR